MGTGLYSGGPLILIWVNFVAEKDLSTKKNWCCGKSGTI
jgi:hypothetical protein